MFKTPLKTWALEFFNLNIEMNFTILYGFEDFILNFKKMKDLSLLEFFHLKCYKPLKYNLPKFWRCPPIPLEK
jgi:hypothetical protein